MPKITSCAFNSLKSVFRVETSFWELCLIKIPNVGYCRLIDLIPWFQIRIFYVKWKERAFKMPKITSCALNSLKSVFRVETSFWELSHKNTECRLLSPN